MTILVAGGASASGASFVLSWISAVGERVINVDNVARAGNLDALASLAGDARHVFVLGEVSERRLIDALLHEHTPRAVVYFTTESDSTRHVDEAPTFDLLQADRDTAVFNAVRSYWHTLPESQQSAFRFIRVSSAEVHDESAGAAVLEGFDFCAVQTIEVLAGLPPITRLLAYGVRRNDATRVLIATLCASPEPAGFPRRAVDRAGNTCPNDEAAGALEWRHPRALISA
jgi:hypothetical protein